MNKTFRETTFGDTVMESITDWGHTHIVAPPDYDEPETPGDGSSLGLGLRLLALSAALVIGCAAFFIWPKG